MSGSVLASIMQDCKAHNKCFTSSPQDATPVQGLHSSTLSGDGGKKEVGGKVGGGEREDAAEERVKGFPHSKHGGEILKMLHVIHLEEFLSSTGCL